MYEIHEKKFESIDDIDNYVLGEWELGRAFIDWLETNAEYQDVYDEEVRYFRIVGVESKKTLGDYYMDFLESINFDNILDFDANPLPLFYELPEFAQIELRKM